MNLDLRDESIKGANTKYVKFIIFAFARSGSTFLHGSLLENKNIIQYSEIFSNPNKITFGNAYGNNHNETPKELLTLRNEHPIDFLEKYIFTSYNSAIKAVGFKVFPEQLENDKFKQVWLWIVKNKDIKIINLIRHNFLKSYLSRSIARKDKVYNIIDKTQRSSTTITLDINEFLEYLETRENYQKQIELICNNRDHIHLSYDNLYNNPNSTFQIIFDFLEIDTPIDFKQSKLIKKETRNLKDIIENYEEVYSRLCNTKWKFFFDKEYN